MPTNDTLTKTPTSPVSRVNSQQIKLALARHFNWFHNVVMTEWWIDGGQADLVVIHPSGYATEVEVKISKSDWNADRDKKKWSELRGSVARFFYAVPEALAENIPDFVPESAGILSILQRKDGTLRVRVVRNARRRKAQPITQSEREHIYQRSYIRFWRYQFRAEGMSEE